MHLFRVFIAKYIELVAEVHREAFRELLIPL